MVGVVSAIVSFVTGPVAYAQQFRPLARPSGGSFNAGRAAARPEGGPLLGVEAGWAALLPTRGEQGQESASFAVRAGWAFANGLELHFRYDDLGVAPDDSSTPLQTATVGVRYSLPFILPLPFAEVGAGPAFLGGDVLIGASAGIGVSIPLGPFVLLDVVGHDCLKPIDGTLRVYSARSQERDEQIDVLASNGLRIALDTSIRYHILAEEAVKLDREFGAHYYDILLGPTLRSQARRVVGRYQPEEIYSTQREAIERQIREGVEKAIEGRHVVLEAVLVRNVTLPESIQQAINDKLQAEQAALKMKFVLEQAQAEAQKRMIEQKAEADRARVAAASEAETTQIAARGRAEATRIDAEATAEYERLIQLHLTAPMLQWQEIEALRSLGASPNSKILFYGSGHPGGTILELK